ncbi:helix-turn-helix domain-containing protein [Agromyces sp. NPDC058104]|uniref:helix-turn-helix domain-containing protein n=1 Tax=Agromyces sp. NPDC058104 TaxID=3346342 RepID=UPI0036D8A6BA
MAESAEVSRKSGFGDVIREARKKQGWSQAELGEKSGLSRPTIARIEGNNDVTTATIAKVAQALGLKLELRDEG